MNLIITIGREIGSGGHEIGKKLAEALGIAFYDQELIEEASKESGVSEELIAKGDEKAPGLLDYALLGGWGNDNVLSCGNFYILQSRVIKRIVDQGACVIVGRSADYLLRNHPHCLQVFIHAPIDFRSKRLRDTLLLTEEKALSLIDKKDAERAKYYNFYTDKQWGKSNSYHLSLDSSLLGIEGTINLLTIFVEKFKQRHHL